MLTPASGNNKTPPMNETAMPIITQNARRNSRNKARITKTITTAEPYDYGNRGMSTQQGIIYYAFNLLEEIDQPGEWYLDRNKGVLYIYPPSDPSKATVEIGMLSEPMISAKGVSDVRFEGLAFDGLTLLPETFDIRIRLESGQVITITVLENGPDMPIGEPNPGDSGGAEADDDEFVDDDYADDSDPFLWEPEDEPEGVVEIIDPDEDGYFEDWHEEL